MPDGPRRSNSPDDVARRSVDRLIAGAGAAAEPFVHGASVALDAAAQTIRELPGMRVRRVRRQGRLPLDSLYELHPGARNARPVDVGLRSIPVEEIRGTAVGGEAQRGGDFLPLKPFRGRNWHGRWQRLRRAQDRLEALPPVDVVKYAEGYWIVDGHNRVALALYGGQHDIDADVIELVPPGGRRTEPIGSLQAHVEAARPMRARAKQPEP